MQKKCRKAVIGWFANFAISCKSKFLALLCGRLTLPVNQRKALVRNFVPMFLEKRFYYNVATTVTDNSSKKLLRLVPWLVYWSTVIVQCGTVPFPFKEPISSSCFLTNGLTVLLLVWYKTFAPKIFYTILNVDGFASMFVWLFWKTIGR